MSYCTVLYYTILYYTILYYTILYYTILYYTILYYTILYYTILYYTILYDTILYYTVLYCTIFSYAMLCYALYLTLWESSVRLDTQVQVVVLQEPLDLEADHALVSPLGRASLLWIYELYELYVHIQKNRYIYIYM